MLDTIISNTLDEMYYTWDNYLWDHETYGSDDPELFPHPGDPPTWEDAEAEVYITILENPDWVAPDL